MRVLHVNSKVIVGGAGRAAYRLHCGLKNLGEESRIVTSHGADYADMADTWTPKTPFWKNLWYVNRKIGKQTGLDGLADISSVFGWKPYAKWADLVHLHNLHGDFFSLFLLPFIEEQAPLVWTTHDMWPLTGKCACSASCDGWLQGCGKCGEYRNRGFFDIDKSALLFKIRKQLYSRISPVMIAPSRWILRRIRRAPLTRGFQSVHIPNGIDTSVFTPRDKEKARRKLGIKSEKCKIIFGSSISPKKGGGKGGDLLLSALKKMRASGRKEIKLLLAGSKADKVRDICPYPVIDSGYVESEEEMSWLYSAADVFVLPTREEILGNVLLESMACGTPCVSFRVGGVPDAVRPGKTGWLASAEDSNELAGTINEALKRDKIREEMANNCRNVAVEEYDINIIAKRHQNIYLDLLSERQEK